MKIPKAKGSLDFIGLNYYSHYNYKFSFNLDKAFKAKLLPGEIKTDMDYASYPEGFTGPSKRFPGSAFRSLSRKMELPMPGMTGAHCLSANTCMPFLKPFQDGYKVEGYYYWSLMDNFEWSLGYDMKFGLYSVDWPTQIRILREGSKRYREIIRDFK